LDGIANHGISLIITWSWNPWS